MAELEAAQNEKEDKESAAAATMKARRRWGWNKKYLSHLFIYLYFFDKRACTQVGDRCEVRTKDLDYSRRGAIVYIGLLGCVVFCGKFGFGVFFLNPTAYHLMNSTHLC